MGNKIFIIGLPRTATTSICKATLELGLTTAHTAYIQKCFQDAQVIADTPIFCDYPLLDEFYPGAKFVHLTRDMSVWIPSIRQLLERMYHNLQRDDGGFNTIIKRCYNQIFAPLTLENIASDQFLGQCFERHQRHIIEYFKDRPNDLLQIDLSDNSSYQALLDFLELASPSNGEFSKVNVGGKVTAWKQIKSPLKIESTRRGRIDTLPYLSPSSSASAKF